MAEGVVVCDESNVVKLSSRRAGKFVEPAKVPSAKPEQLGLALEGERTLILLATDSVHGEVFLRTLVNLRPRVLLDLRYAPHFEFTAVPGNVAGRIIKRLGVRYVLHSVPFHEYRTNILGHGLMQLAEELLSIGYGEDPVLGPLMVLMQHRADAEAFGPYLAGALERADKGLWTVNLYQRR